MFLFLLLILLLLLLLLLPLLVLLLLLLCCCCVPTLRACQEMGQQRRVLGSLVTKTATLNNSTRHCTHAM